MNKTIRWGELVKAQHVAQTLGITQVYGSYNELLADSQMDAVYIPRSNQLHFEWAVRSLQAGKHVLCEKLLWLRWSETLPLALTA